MLCHLQLSCIVSDGSGTAILIASDEPAWNLLEFTPNSRRTVQRIAARTALGFRYSRASNGPHREGEAAVVTRMFEKRPLGASAWCVVRAWRSAGRGEEGAWEGGGGVPEEEKSGEMRVGCVRMETMVPVERVVLRLASVHRTSASHTAAYFLAALTTPR